MGILSWDHITSKTFMKGPFSGMPIKDCLTHRAVRVDLSRVCLPEIGEFIYQKNPGFLMHLIYYICNVAQVQFVVVGTVTKMNHAALLLRSCVLRIKL